MATQTLTAPVRPLRGTPAETVRRLEAAGVPHADISLVSNDAAHGQYYGAVPGDAAPMSDIHHHPGYRRRSLAGHSCSGAGAGLLAGLGMLAIPGLGPVVAAGWLASTLPRRRCGRSRRRDRGIADTMWASARPTLMPTPKACSGAAPCSP